MSRRQITAGNDAPFRWAVKLQGKPFDLSGKDVKVYVINSRGEIPVARLTIEGHEVSGVFEGRYQTRLGEHSLVLRVNEGRPEMKTAAVAKVFELVQWSAEAGGSDEGDVIVAPVLIESELSIGGSSYDDTEVKTELARLEREKADKQELTELSAEVSGLSEKIENLPSAESDVFKAEYGVTTFEEIKAAYDSGKVVHCDYKTYCYVLSRILDVAAYFDAMSAPNSYRITCGTDGWTENTYQLELKTNKTTTINAESTDTQYPSAKAVYEALQNVGGGEQEVFWATEGITDASKGTTYDEILAAHNAGKVVKCLYQNIVFDLRYITNILYFAANVSDYLYYLKCPQSNRWQYTAENTDHSLTTLANGNVQVTIAGKTAEVATPQYVENAIQQSGTPSGDPMHYMFEAAGATYNATDADIPMVGIYGDSYVHKAKHWHLNELGDITNEEMRAIYRFPMPLGGVRYSVRDDNAPIRTLIGNPFESASNPLKLYSCLVDSAIETVRLGFAYATVNEWQYTFDRCPKLTKVLDNYIDCNSLSTYQRNFRNCSLLRDIRLKKVKCAMSFEWQPNLSNASILYIILNEVATSAIVITLHADAYARAMADAEIVAALEAHPNVSLASA